MENLVIPPNPAPSDRQLRRAARIQKKLAALREQLDRLLEEPCQQK